ncbi:YfjL-like protein [Bacillus cabrialesii]
MKRIVFGFLAIAVFGCGLYIYHVLFGDPFSKNAAEQKLTSYVKQTYPKKEINITNGVYSAKTTEYVFQANIQSHRYPMCTKGFLHPKVTCDGIEEAYTESVAKHLNEEASKEIEADLKKEVSQIIKADAALIIENGQFTLDTKWNKQLAEKANMNMTIQLDASGLSKTDAAKMAETVRKTLNEKGYTYSNGTVDCMQKDGDGGFGYVKYSIDFLPKTAIQPKDAEELGS